MRLLFPLDLVNFLLVVLDNRSINPLFIIIIRGRLNFNLKVWVLREQEAVEEFGAESERSSVFKDHVDELTFTLIDDIMIANNLVALLLFRDAIASACDTVAHEREPNTDKSVLDKVHFCDFHIFIIDYLIILVRVKIPWHKPMRNITQKAIISQSFLVEKSSLLSENVGEEEFGPNLIFDRGGDQVK